MRLTHAALIGLLVGSEYGCTIEQKSGQSLLMEIVVESDPSVALSGVPVYVDGEIVGRTDMDGRIRVSLIRNTGDLVTVAPECPAGHELVGPVKALRVRRYQRIDTDSGIQLRLRCRPSVRLAAFVVRATNGPGINVMLDGETVATTDANGIAQFSRRNPPGTEYIVQLDAGPRPSLLPRRTSHVFVLPDASEVFVVDQAFQLRTPRKRREPQRQRIIKIE